MYALLQAPNRIVKTTLEPCSPGALEPTSDGLAHKAWKHWINKLCRKLLPMHKQKWNVCWMICYNTLSQLFHTVKISAWHTYIWIGQKKYFSLVKNASLDSWVWLYFSIAPWSWVWQKIYKLTCFLVVRIEYVGAKKSPSSLIFNRSTSKWSFTETAIDKGLQPPCGLRMEVQLRGRAHRDLKVRSRTWRGRVQSIHVEFPGWQEHMLMSQSRRSGLVMGMSTCDPGI